MFYSQLILARKGPLGKIWLAAHFDKKLSKNQIFSTDITGTVDTVLSPNSNLALRVSGHLMLGIVRIYSKKVKYLMIDCTEAMWKMKLAFKPGKVDIDPSIFQLTIDDHRHYGNLSMDQNDHIGFDTLVFGSGIPVSMLSISRLGYLDDDSVFTDETNEGFDAKPSTDPANTAERSVLSDVEDIRGAVSRSSIESSRGSSTLNHDFKRNSISAVMLDDDLPVFEDTAFDDVIIQSQLQSGSADGYGVDINKNAADPKSKMVSTKKKVQLDNRIECSEVQFRQRVAEPNVFLRTIRDIKMQKAFSLSQDDAFSPTLFHTDLCSELSEIYSIFCDSIPLPFPLKRQCMRDSCSEVEDVRHEIEDKYSLPSASVAADSFEQEHLKTSDVHEFDLSQDEMIFSSISPVKSVEVCPNDMKQTKDGGVLMSTILSGISTANHVESNNLFQGLNKSKASKFFLELLQLKSKDLIQLVQEQPYASIQITKLASL